jgi:P27 family predicted phage terminase small subunit
MTNREIKLHEKAVSEHLTSIGKNSDLYTNQIKMYCASLRTFWTIEKFIQDNGITYDIRLKDGTIKAIYKRPELQIQKDAHCNIMTFVREFGLTPKALEALTVSTPPEEDDFEKLKKDF